WVGHFLNVVPGPFSSVSYTSGDLRFCALLRLNMPTKEIAKLLNISTRGVDAARYRLRKKFNLLPEESLTDFLINFK
uniref:helix-turn-helix transcriptional regulator n=1 Tax=Bacteroides uniformis TaxID=820 RepID=UPI001E579064